ncbi:hypothetical protein ACMFMG_001292 [Clarireedia jacksonii]
MASLERLSKRQRKNEAPRADSPINGSDSNEAEIDLPLQRGPHLPPSSIEPAEPVFLNEHNEHLRRADTSIYGTLSERSARIIRALQAAGCATQLYCHGGYSVPPERCELYGGKGIVVICCVILYGLNYISEDVGSWLSKYGLFLQDPVHCDRNVLYHNPHILYEDNHEPVMTFSFSFHAPSAHMEVLKVAPNLFELLNQERILPEAQQPSLVTTLLHKSVSKHSFITLLSKLQTPKASFDIHVKARTGLSI